MYFQQKSKLISLALVAMTTISLQACLDKSQFAKVKSDDEKVAYTLGFNFGKQLSANTEGLDVNVIIAGLKEGFAKEEGRLTEDEMVAAMQGFSERRQATINQQREEMATKNQEKGAAFLTENKAKAGVVALDSGLQYKVITEGSGAKPKAEDTVTVHYRGSLIDGTVFDSSVDRGEPATFALNRVIPGWTEALQLMKKGSKWEIYIPADLAYGERGAGVIEPYATLIFEVELLDVVPAAKAGK